jgi:hypothetical protein
VIGEWYRQSALSVLTSHRSLFTTHISLRAGRVHGRSNLTTPPRPVARSLLRRTRTSGFTTAPRCGSRLSRERSMRCSPARFAFKCALRCARSRARGTLLSTPSFSDVALGLFSCSSRCRSFLGRRQFYSGAAGFRQADGDGLFGRTRAMFSFANMFHFFADKFSGLS